MALASPQGGSASLFARPLYPRGAMTGPLLYDYHRSSACYRVRIALNLKSVEYEAVPVNLLEGEHQGAAYRARNPQGFVPMLEADGLRLTQSLAIIGWLEQRHPEPLLIPADPGDAAHVRSLALTIACDIHPLNNVRVLRYLAGPLGQPEGARNDWYRHWIAEGFTALEALALPRAGRFLFGDTPTLADACLVPQMYNARRFEVPLDPYPTLVRADAEANRLDAFVAAHPDRVAPPNAKG
jgi:maleylacetoacetate isomerase